MDTVNTSFNKNEIPVKWGIIISILNVIFFTILNKFVLSSEKMTSYYAGLALTFIVTIILLSLSATRQRKAMGGYITFKECFRGLFISILIICVVAGLYQLIYLKFIDPSFPERMKEASIAMAERMGAPQEKLDEVAAKMDEQVADRNNVGKQLLSILWAVVFYSIIGFIISAVVKRNKPFFNQEDSQQQFQQ